MGGGPDHLRGVRAFYATGEELELGEVPEGTQRVVARRATGQVWQVGLPSEDASRALPPGTYAIEALD